MPTADHTLWCETCNATYRLPDFEPGRPYRCARCQGFLHQPEPTDQPAVWVYSATPSGSDRRGQHDARTTWTGSNDEPPSPPPKQFAGYPLLGELGRGGMGVVYRAWDPDRGIEVALKVLIGGRWADRTAVERFLREALAATKLSHPGLVRVLDSGEWQGQPWYAMELIDGPSLKDLLDEVGRPPLEEAIRITAELARAIQHAHDRGVSHRDVKPENVLLRVHGQPVLTDFGLVLESHHARLTHTGQVMGTPAYLAPELARGAKDPNWPLVDVYALGALLYELLTGRPAYEGDSGMQVLMDVIEGPPRSPRSIRPDIPRSLDILVQRAMARLPTARIQSAQALADDLERARAGLPILARPLSASYRTRLWLQRNGRAVGAVVAALLVTAGVASIVAGARARMAADAQAHAWDAADHRLTQLRPEWDALEAAGDLRALDDGFATFVTGDRWQGAPALSVAWRLHAQRLRARGDADGELDAAGHAWAVAPTQATERAALDALVEAMTARWWYGRIESLVGPGTDSRKAVASVVRRDREGANAAWSAQPEGRPPVAPLVEALLVGHPTGHYAGAAQVLDADRVLLVGDEVALVRADPSLSDARTWDLGRKVAVAIPVSQDRVVTWADGLAEILERSASGPWVPVFRWEVSRVTDAVALDLPGEPSIVVALGYFSRQLQRIDRTPAGWQNRSAHDGTNQSASDILALHPADLNGDGTGDLLVLAGPWNAFDVRWFSTSPTGELLLEARRKLGYASDVATLTVGGEPRVAVIKADQYPSRRTFAASQPYGEPAGVYLLDPGTLNTTDQRRLTAPIGESPPDTARLIAADLDGDGLDDLAYTAVTGHDKRWLMLYRQDASGDFSHARLEGLTLLAAIQADADPAMELIVGVAGGDASPVGELWVLGAGDTPLPSLAPVALPQPATPNGLGPTSGRIWDRANRLATASLFAPAAALFEELASSPIPPILADRAWLRAAELWLAADRPARAADVAGHVVSGELHAQALNLRSTALIRAYRFQDAKQADQLLAPLEIDDAVRESIRDREALYGTRTSAPPIELSFDRPMDPAWVIDQPLALHRDPRAGTLLLDSITGLGDLARLPLQREEEVLALEVDGTIERLEWGSGLSISLQTATEPGLSFEVGGWGGGALLERQLGCRIGARYLVGPRAPAAPDDTVAVRVRIEVAPRLREVRCSILGDSGTPIHEARAPLDGALPDGDWELVIRSGGEDAVETPMHARIRLDRIGVRGAQIRRSTPTSELGREVIEGDLEGALATLPPGPSVLRAALQTELGDSAGARKVLPVPDLRKGLPSDLALLMRSRPQLASSFRPAFGDGWFRAWHAAWNVAAVSHPDDPWLHERLRADLDGIEAWNPTDFDGRATKTELLGNRGLAWLAAGRSSAARADLLGAVAGAKALIDEATRTNNGPRLQSGRQVWMDSYAALASIALTSGEDASARQYASNALERAPIRQIAIDRLLLDPRIAERRRDPAWAALLKP